MRRRWVTEALEARDEAADLSHQRPAPGVRVRLRRGSPADARPGHLRDAEWADYVFNRNGAPGVKKEWWCHIASGIWFIAERDTATDDVLRTYLWVKAEA